MKAHTDKYNGSCVHKERIKEFGYNDGQFEIFEKDENTQEERSDKGSKLYEVIMRSHNRTFQKSPYVSQEDN